MDIHRWHKERGFDGIGYHYVICEDGTTETGRPHYWSGAHVAGHNKDTLGVCLIGRDEFTDQQMGALVELYDKLAALYPEAEWLNHRDLDPDKTCPNFDAAGLLTGIN